MITIIVKGSNLNKALNQFKDAMYRTRAIPRHVDSLTYEKPSDKKRRQRLRAIHREQLKNQSREF